MSESENFQNQRSMRSYFKQLTIHKILERYPVSESDSVLELGIGDDIFSKTVRKHLTTGSIYSASQFSNNLSLRNKNHENFNVEYCPIENLNFENKFNLIFAFWHIHLSYFQKDEIHDELVRIYNALSSNGQLLIVIFSPDTSAVKTFKQVIDSGAVSGLSNEFIYYDNSVIEITEKCIKSIPFKNVKIAKEKLQFEIPNPYIFQQYLNEISFLYKKISSTELSNKIIKKQVEYFEEWCKKNHNGKYIYVQNPFIISARK